MILFQFQSPDTPQCSQPLLLRVIRTTRGYGIPQNLGKRLLASARHAIVFVVPARIGPDANSGSPREGTVCCEAPGLSAPWHRSLAAIVTRLRLPDS